MTGHVLPREVASSDLEEGILQSTFDETEVFVLQKGESENMTVLGAGRCEWQERHVKIMIL